MKERVEFKKLVVAILHTQKCPITARDIYEEIKHDQPQVLRRDSVLCFKSFCRLIPVMDIKPVGSGIKKYIPA